MKVNFDLKSNLQSEQLLELTPRYIVSCPGASVHREVTQSARFFSINSRTVLTLLLSL